MSQQSYSAVVVFSVILTDFDCIFSKIVREYDQEIPQSQTADNPVAP